MSVKEVPIVIWIALLIGFASILMTVIEIYGDNFRADDVAMILDAVLGVLAIGLIFRVKVFYLLFVFLIALKVIAGFGLCVFSIAFIDIYDSDQKIAIAWVVGVTLTWLVFYILLRRANVRAWYNQDYNK